MIAGEGDPEYARHLRSLFPEEATRFLGWTQPHCFFQNVDVNVVPSLWAEPFGRVGVESQAYGIPVLVARSGGLPSNIQEGQTGFSFEPGDAAGLAQHVARLLL